MSVRVMVSFPDEFLKEIDREAQAEHRSRSEFFREAVRFYMRQHKRRTLPGDNPTVQTAVAAQDRLAAAASASSEDSMEILRYWREQR